MPPPKSIQAAVLHAEAVDRSLIAASRLCLCPVSASSSCSLLSLCLCACCSLPLRSRLHTTRRAQRAREAAAAKAVRAARSVQDDTHQASQAQSSPARQLQAAHADSWQPPTSTDASTLSAENKELKQHLAEAVSLLEKTRHDLHFPLSPRSHASSWQAQQAKQRAGGPGSTHLRCMLKAASSAGGVFPCSISTSFKLLSSSYYAPFSFLLLCCFIPHSSSLRSILMQGQELETVLELELGLENHRQHCRPPLSSSNSPKPLADIVLEVATCHAP